MVEVAVKAVKSVKSVKSVNFSDLIEVIEANDPIARTLIFETPFITSPATTLASPFGSLRRTLFATPETTGRRTKTYNTSRGVQVVDYDIVDEPWVWAPVRTDKSLVLP